MKEVVTGAVETSRPIIDARRHHLVITMPETPLRVHGDFARLTQVIANLLNNAAKYQAEGGRIEIAVTTEGPDAVIAVTDQGMGLAPEVIPMLFELFSQGERSPDSAHGGLGIGLSLVKNLVELHGGSVVAESGGLGRGSRFVVRFPVYVGEAPLPKIKAVRGDAPAPARRRILVVDDSRDAAESLATLLKLGGHDVLVAHDGQRALELSASEHPSVVLLDIGLPGMDGYEVCRRVRQMGDDVLIIAMTGYGQERDRQRSSEAGFDDHTVKPVEIDELSRLIASH
jgi:CheY-like chemotaxis protein